MNAGISFEALWYESRTALDRLSAAATSYNTTHCENAEASCHIPIFMVHVMYQVASMLTRLAQIAPDEEIQDKVERFKQLMGLVNSRWRIAGKFVNEWLSGVYNDHDNAKQYISGVYLNILEAEEMAISSEAIKTQYSLRPTDLTPTSFTSGPHP